MPQKQRAGSFNRYHCSVCWLLGLFLSLLLLTLYQLNSWSEESFPVRNGEATMRHSGIFGLRLDDILLTAASKRSSFCPNISDTRVYDRYRQLQYSPGTNNPAKRTYFIAVNLHDNAEILPNLIIQLSDVLRILGPHRVHLTVFENGSHDETKWLLRRFERFLVESNISFHIETSFLEKDLRTVHRIEYMAMLRNRVLEDFYRPTHPRWLQQNAGKIVRFDELIFLNDVLFCAVDVLELLLQKQHQQADMVTGLDFDVSNGKPGFYDMWVTRDVNGRYISSKMDLDRMFSDHDSNHRMNHGLPFEVYCSWNGMAIISAKPFYEPASSPLRFRRALTKKLPKSLEAILSKPSYLLANVNSLATCSGSEVSVFCRDLHDMGHHKIAIIPTVKLAYTFKDYQIVKKRFPNDFDKMIQTPLLNETRIPWRVDQDLPTAQWVTCLPMNAKGNLHPEGPWGEEFVGYPSSEFADL